MIKFEFKWEIEDFERFSKASRHDIASTGFCVSPDKVCHRWKVSLYGEEEHYKVSLQLRDKNQRKPVYAKIAASVYNDFNELVCEAENKRFHEIENYSSCVMTVSPEVKSIKTVCLSIELARENQSQLDSDRYQSADSEIIINKPVDSEQLDNQSRPLQNVLSKLYESEFSSDLTVNRIISELFAKFIYTGATPIPGYVISDILYLSVQNNLQDLSKICQCEKVKNISASAANDRKMAEMERNIRKFIKGNIKDVLESEAFKTATCCDLKEVMFSAVASNDEGGEYNL